MKYRTATIAIAIRMTRTTVRFDTACSVWARSGGRALAAATDEGGNPAADHEPGDGGADDRVALVTSQLRAPVGQFLDLRLEVVHRERQLAAGLLDRGPDLGGCALGRRHQLCSMMSSRMSRASSIAMSGVGGAPFLIQRRPMKPAIAAKMKRKPNTMMKPIQGLVVTTLKRSLR